MRIGLDIAEDAVRFLALKSARSLRVKYFYEVPLPKEAIQDGKIIVFDAVKEALDFIVKKTHSKNQSVHIALPLQHVIIKSIRLPSLLTDHECEIEIETRLSHYLPGVHSKVHFDFIRQDKTNNDEQNILLIAAKSEILNAYCEVVQSVGLNIKSVDIDIYALSRAVRMGDAKIFSCYAILDYGVSRNYFIVVQNQAVIFYETFFLKNTPEIIAKVSQLVATCSAMHHEISLQKIILSGEKSQLMDLMREFSERTHFSVTFFSSSEDVHAKLEDQVTRFTKALGLSLWGL